MAFLLHDSTKYEVIILNRLNWRAKLKYGFFFREIILFLTDMNRSRVREHKRFLPLKNVKESI